MSDAVVVGLFGLVGVMYAATLPVLFSARKHAKTSADQTRNKHDTNLRDDVDIAIVGLHNLHDALGLEDSFVRERAESIRARRKEHHEQVR